jgi:hypothetical protein
VAVMTGTLDYSAIEESINRSFEISLSPSPVGTDMILERTTMS